MAQQREAVLAYNADVLSAAASAESNRRNDLEITSKRHSRTCGQGAILVARRFCSLSRF